MLPFPGMSSQPDDQEPETRRDLPLAGPQRAFMVDITYREPSYALYSGTERAYGGTFRVLAADERDAEAQARARFDAVAASSGVGWSREIVDILCRLA